MTLRLRTYMFSTNNYFLVAKARLYTLSQRSGNVARVIVDSCRRFTKFGRTPRVSEQWRRAERGGAGLTRRHADASVAPAPTQFTCAYSSRNPHCYRTFYYFIILTKSILRIAVNHGRGEIN